MSRPITLNSHTRVHHSVHHQDRLDRRRRWLHRWVLRGLAFRLLAQVTVENEALVPESGPTLFVMNHIGAIDPFVVVGAVRTRMIVPMSKIENYEHPVVGMLARTWGAFPVRRGEVDRQALQTTLALLEQGRPVLMAPEGTRHTELREPKDGMAYIGLKSGVAIVPVGLDGTDRFVHHLKRLRRTPVTVRIGRPFVFRTEDGARVPRERLHQMTQEAMYQLAALLPDYRRGSYHDLAHTTTDTIRFLDE